MPFWRPLVGLAITAGIYLFAGPLFVNAEPERALYPLSEGLPGISKVGYVDIQGHLAIPFRFDSAERFIEGRAKVGIGRKYGFIDSRGKLVVDAKYDGAHAFSEGRAAVFVGRLWGVIDLDGNVIAEPQYSSVKDFSDGLAVVSKPFSNPKERLYGAIDTTGRVIFGFEHEVLGNFSEGRAVTRRNGKYGYISKTGALVIPAIYDFAQPFKDGLAQVGMRRSPGPGTLFGTIDVDGNIVTPFAFGRLGEFKDGRAPAANTSTSKIFHFVDRSGARSSPDIPFARYCFGGLPELSDPIKSSTGKCMYADADGNNKFGRDFDKAWRFQDGLALIQVGADEGFGPLGRPVKTLYWGVIDPSGVFITPPVFDTVLLDKPGVIEVGFGDGRRGYLDRQGRPLTFPAQELEKYVASMHDAFSIAGQVPGRTITARAADIDYYFYLPRGLCALDRAEAMDRQLLDEAREQQSAARQKQVEERIKSKRPLNDEELLAPSPGQNLFAPCDQLHTFRATGDKKLLSRVGSAVGSRRGRPDPSANAGLFYIARMMCSMMSGSGGLHPKLEAPFGVQEEYVAKAWTEAAAGRRSVVTPAYQMLGCTSATLSPGREAEIVAMFVTLGFAPDWSFQVTRRETLRSKEELIDILKQEVASSEAIVTLNFRANIH